MGTDPVYSKLNIAQILQSYVVISSEVNYIDIPSKERDHVNAVGVYLLRHLVVLEILVSLSN